MEQRERVGTVPTLSLCYGVKGHCGTIPEWTSPSPSLLRLVSPLPVPPSSAALPLVRHARPHTHLLRHERDLCIGVSNLMAFVKDDHAPPYLRGHMGGGGEGERGHTVRRDVQVSVRPP